MLLDDVFARYRAARACMDQTGMGEKPVEDAQRRHGTTRVQGVLFTAAAKLEMATRGKEGFEDRKLRIPEGRSDLRADLHKLKKVTGATGVPRFVAESDSNGHADRTWACFLALQAASGGQAPIEFIPLPALPRGFDNLSAADRDNDEAEDYLRLVEPRATW